MKAHSSNGKNFEVISKKDNNRVVVIREDGSESIIMLAFCPLFDENNNAIDLNNLPEYEEIEVLRTVKKEKRNSELASYLSDSSEKYMNKLKKYGK